MQKDKEEIEKVQVRAIRLMQDLRSHSYEDKLKELGLFSMAERRLRGDLIECFKIIKGFDKVNIPDFFELAGESTITRGHTYKILKKHSRLDVRKCFFTQRVVSIWNSLPSAFVECRTVDSFKSSLDRFLCGIGILLETVAY